MISTDSQSAGSYEFEKWILTSDVKYVNIMTDYSSINQMRAIDAVATQISPQLYQVKSRSKHPFYH